MVLPAASRRVVILVLAIGAAIGAAIALGSSAFGRPAPAVPPVVDHPPHSEPARAPSLSVPPADAQAASATSPAQPSATAQPSVPTQPSSTDPSPAPVAAPTLIDALAALRASERPAALLEWAAQAADREPALALLEARDARLRLAAILALKSQRERPAVARALKQRREREPDPRVRQALDPESDLDQLPDWARQPPRITLPDATARAPARSVDVLWDTRDGGAPTNRTTIKIDNEGRATVETMSDDRDAWHVRYAGWAWRDAQGNLVVDARSQPVEQLRAPDRAGPGNWSPDSFIITPDGQCRTVDDREQRCPGAAAVPGAG